MEIKSYGKSDVGRVRSGNEDFFTTEKISEDEELYIVADGMGGHKAGDIASSLGTRTFVSEFRKNREKNISINKSMSLALLKANRKILDTANSEIDKRGMGTTFSAILFKGDKANIIHVGDSRIYLIRDNKMERITTDHTFVEKMRAEGRITDEEARRHPQKNILYMSLGAREEFDPFITMDYKIKDGDIFLLCSDGLTDMVEDHVIKEYCLAYPPKKAVEELIELSNRNGGIDNITILNIHVGNNNARDKTHPIKIGKKTKRTGPPYLKLGIIALLLILSLFLIKVVFFRHTLSTVPALLISPLSQSELQNLSNENAFIADSTDTESELPDNKPIYYERRGEKELIFFSKYYIIKTGTAESVKKYYNYSGRKLKMEKIFFIRNMKSIVALDDENKAYKISIKDD